MFLLESMTEIWIFKEKGVFLFVYPKCCYDLQGLSFLLQTPVATTSTRILFLIVNEFLCFKFVVEITDHSGLRYVRFSRGVFLMQMESCRCVLLCRTRNVPNYKHWHLPALDNRAAVMHLLRLCLIKVSVLFVHWRQESVTVSGTICVFSDNLSPQVTELRALLNETCD